MAATDTTKDFPNSPQLVHPPLYIFLLKKMFVTRESRPTAVEFKHFHAREIHFQKGGKGVKIVLELKSIIKKKYDIYHKIWSLFAVFGR